MYNYRSTTGKVVTFQLNISANQEKILLTFPPNKILSGLYSLLESDNKEVFNYVYGIIKVTGGVDYSQLASIVKNEKIEMKKRALSVLALNKYSYSENDLAAMKEIVGLLEEQFPPVVEVVKQKGGILGGKEKSFWICTCGNKNEIEYKFCKKCRKDKRGFTQKDARPEKVAVVLKNKISILERYV